MQQARPGAIVVNTVIARAQQKRLLHGVDGVVYRTCRCKWPVVTAFAIARTAMLCQLRKIMIFGDEDVREAFVVTQNHIEFWLQLLDEISFQQERLSLTRRHHKFHIARE